MCCSRACSPLPGRRAWIRSFWGANEVATDQKPSQDVACARWLSPWHGGRPGWVVVGFMGPTATRRQALYVKFMLRWRRCLLIFDAGSAAYVRISKRVYSNYSSKKKKNVFVQIFSKLVYIYIFPPMRKGSFFFFFETKKGLRVFTKRAKKK